MFYVAGMHYHDAKKYIIDQIKFGIISLDELNRMIHGVQKKISKYVLIIKESISAPVCPSFDIFSLRLVKPLMSGKRRTPL